MVHVFVDVSSACPSQDTLRVRLAVGEIRNMCNDSGPIQFSVETPDSLGERQMLLPVDADQPTRVIWLAFI